MEVRLTTVTYDKKTGEEISRTFKYVELDYDPNERLAKALAEGFLRTRSKPLGGDLRNDIL